ncbi:hypothetical protein [Mucilaginibacter sp. KACC 22063]|uniref:hypothetical protein n=1 Tax=Mucilaginibacter sp. KACC 22063 TaxID=3025666 RepID=UPI00236634BE|nr:hypothetical protein [Mucilaginibacter sp. KACC 22063]WDF53482.1 hypothetical protein PQ461_11055 [Mucilaginibacter sp. KACC 22063]
MIKLYLNFSDIMQVAWLGTSLVSLFIAYVVFKLQAETFASQQEITRLEQRKFIFQIRPVFKVVNHSTLLAHLNNGFQSHFTIELQDNPAKNIVIENIIDNEVIKYERAGVGDQLTIIEQTIQKGSIGYPVKINVRFQDEIGTSYIQSIAGDFQDLFIEIPINTKEF